jgi:CheY-like chemotaxis protein
MLERSLAKRSKALSTPSALEIILSAANGMAIVHSQGFVHRDLKPDNLLIRSRDGIVKIADLGLASTHEPHGTQEHPCLVGTLGFLSPEVIVGSPATPASDVYALGASLYELLTGWLPYGNVEENRYYELQLSEDPTDPREYVPSLESDIVAVIMKCLKRDPSERYQDAGELQRALIDLKVALPGNTSFIKSETALMNAPVVMVVDDNEPVLELMKDALEASGFRPVCFRDPLEALRNLEKVQPEIAVLDRRMPRIDGVSLCRLLRQREGYQDFPVLMVSADNDQQTVLQAVRSGIDDYLTKPVNVHDVIVRVRLLSKLHRARRQRKASQPVN